MGRQRFLSQAFSLPTERDAHPSSVADRPSGPERGVGSPLTLVTARGEGARVFTARTGDGHLVEFSETFEAGQRVLSVATLLGCPARCAFCDAGGHYEGRLTASEILDQADWLIERARAAETASTGSNIELHLTRMGEPSFNPDVLVALRALLGRHALPDLGVVVSTIAPAQTERFLEALIGLASLYAPGRLRLRISLQTTDEVARSRLVPVRTQGLAEVAAYGERFAAASGSKVTLVFLAAEGLPIDARAISRRFSPAFFRVRLQALLPTVAGQHSGLSALTAVGDAAALEGLAGGFREAGYEVEAVPGSVAEVAAGAGCGQYVSGGREQLRPRRTAGVTR